MLSPTRRTFLALGALTGAQLVCGCTDDSHHDPAKQAADNDRPLRQRAVAATDALLAAYDAVIAGPGTGQAPALGQLRADVAEHRTALAQGLTTAPASASGSAPAASAGTVGSVAALATAERQTAGARLTDLAAASPAFAKLLASVSASEALHASALGDNGPVAPAVQATPAPSTPASGTPAPGTPASGTPSGKPSPLPSGTTTGLQSALAAEHAAVYGYGVVGAFLPPGPQRDDGRVSYAAHQARRDAWQRIIANSGTAPAAAAPGYRLPFQVKDAATAAQLAAHIEVQLTAVYADLVAAVTGPLRTDAAGALREAALRARHWGADLPALPGMTEPAANSGSTSPSASPSA